MYATGSDDGGCAAGQQHAPRHVSRARGCGAVAIAAAAAPAAGQARRQRLGGGAGDALAVRDASGELPAADSQSGDADPTLAAGHPAAAAAQVCTIDFVSKNRWYYRW